MQSNIPALITKNTSEELSYLNLPRTMNEVYQITGRILEVKTEEVTKPPLGSIHNLPESFQNRGIKPLKLQPDTNYGEICDITGHRFDAIYKPSIIKTGNNKARLLKFLEEDLAGEDQDKEIEVIKQHIKDVKEGFAYASDGVRVKHDYDYY